MLETKRLILRKLEISDGDDLVMILTNPNVYRYLGGGQGITEERARQWPSIFNQRWLDNGYGVFGVVEKNSNKLIGYCGFAPMKDGQELLYGYCQAVWGKGYATEAGQAVLEYARINFDFDWSKIYAISWPQNKGSINLLTKLGFKHIGQAEYFDIMMEEFQL